MSFFLSFSKWAWAVTTLGAIIGLVIIGIVEARTPAGPGDHPEWVAQNSPGAAFLPPKQPKSPTRIPMPDFDDCDVDRLANMPTEDGFIVVSKVLDGDTIQVDQSGTLVGLWGVDAPEAAQPGGQQATEYLASLLPAGTLVKTQEVGYDHTGRLLAVMGTEDDWSVNFKMVFGGWAFEYKASNEPFNPCIHYGERYARDYKEGMWRRYDNGGERPWRWRQRHN